MNPSRVPAPQIDPERKPKGPSSYFPSIEQNYGHPMQHWLDLAVSLLEQGDTHMEAVHVLKQEHQMGHGHANAVIAYVKAKLAQ